MSTEFLLGLTDIPDRKNYDIAEQGLSIQAARNLYTGVVNVQVFNLLLKDPQFAVLSNHVADFFDETMAAGYAAHNQLYASISEVVGRRCGSRNPPLWRTRKSAAHKPHPPFASAVRRKV